MNDTTRPAEETGIARADERPQPSGKQRVLALLRQKIDFPALGASVAKVVQLSSSENEDTQQLADFILSDISLTERVLCVANSAGYQRNAGPCTLVSKAIMVIGLNTVRSIALTSKLLDKLSDRKKAARLKSEFTCSFFASILAREVAERVPHTNPEEVSIGALFKNLGRLMIISLDMELHEQIVACARANRCSENTAAAKIIGMPYDEVSMLVAREWGMPDAIVQSVAPMPPGNHTTALSRESQTRLVVSFSNETAACIAGSIGQQRERLLSGVLHRYGERLQLEHESLSTLTETVGRDTINLTAGLGLTYLVDEPEAVEETDKAASDANAQPAEQKLLPSEGVPPSASRELADIALQQKTAGGHGSARQEEDLLGGSELPGPESAQTTADILLNYVQEIVGTMANGDVRLQEVFSLVLEALYRGMRFKRVLCCMRDPVRGLYRCRTALGADRTEMLTHFQFSLQYSADLFHAALAQGTDVHISDTAQETIAAKLPAWHRRLLPATRSFLLLPLVLNKQPVGFIYADSDACDIGSYTKQEIDLARTLRSQVLLALRTVK